MISLTIKDTLLAYEAPLIVVAQDKKGKPFIGVNYADEENGYCFYFCRIHPKDIQSFSDGECDLLYIVSRRKIGKLRNGIGWGEEGESIGTVPYEELPSSLLPKPGLFIPSTTPSSANSIRKVEIDGRWGINDLRKFSDLVQDCYAFVFALSGEGSQQSRKQTEKLFRKYPWRGGFSSVNFFDDLYSLIPKSEKASISKIQYASPGSIDISLNDDAANTIRNIVSSLNQENNSISECYAEVYKWLKGNGWLSKSSSDIRLSQSDSESLIQNIDKLAVQLGLSKERDRILSLSNSDPLGAIKILLAYYRRLNRLADYVSTGKIQNLF